MSVIEAIGVWKAFTDRKRTKAKVVLKDVNLSIEENEFVCILGSSGCGKTTLLNLMAGFDRPLSGSIRYRGSEVEGPSSERAVVFQEYSLLPWMDVLSNVAFAVDKRITDPEERKAKAMAYLDKVGLSAFADQMPASLSGGMKQRVAIARTLAMEPDVLLMDEPFSSLDEQTKGRLDRELMRIWNEEKRTVVFITHSIDEAMLMATRIVMMSTSPGRIAREWRLEPGTDRDLLSDRFVDLKREILSELSVCSCVSNARMPIAIEGLE